MRLLALFLFFLVPTIISCATSSSQGEPDEQERRSSEGASAADGAEPAASPGESNDDPSTPDASQEATEPDPEPQPAPVIEATKLAPPGDGEKKATTDASLEILERSEKDPVADIPDPQPRQLVTSFDLAYATGRNRGAGFTSGIGVKPYASEVEEVAPRLPEPVAAQYELWFRQPYRATLQAYQDAYGGVLRAERFEVDGEPVQLVVFARSEKLEQKVSIFDEQYFYTAVAFAVGGDSPKPLWAVELSPLFEPYREIDDIQLGPDGRLYVNSNYPSYAKEVDGETAHIFAIAPEQGEVVWRAGPLVSRSDFLVLGDVVLTGYGFTAEPDYLYALDADTGARLDRVKIPSAHDRMRRIDGGVQVVTYDSLLRVSVSK